MGDANMMDRRCFTTGLLVAGAGGLLGCSNGIPANVSPDIGASVAMSGTPGAADLAKEGPLGDKALGRIDAPVTVIEYVSLTCPYSRKFHLETFPRLKTDYIDRGKIRLVLREFPIGRSAAAAAVVTRGAPPGQYFTLYEKFLLQQKDWSSQEVRSDAIYKVAAQIGMTRETFDAVLKNEQITQGLVWVKQRGRELGVSGTPTFFIGDMKKRGALSFDEISEMLNRDQKLKI